MYKHFFFLYIFFLDKCLRDVENLSQHTPRSMAETERSTPPSLENSFAYYPGQIHTSQNPRSSEFVSGYKRPQKVSVCA